MNSPPEIAPATRFRFGVFELDTHARELRKAGSRLKLQPQPLQILTILVQRAGEVVSREELSQQLWPAETYVEFDRSLNRAVVKLRDALGDSAESPRFIETLPKNGYRFIVPVIRSSAPEAPPPTMQHPRRLWILAWAAIAALVLLTTYFAAPRVMRSGHAAPIKSIAVLPLQNLSGDSNQEFFADGMTDELISDLAQISALRVISRTSVMEYKATRMSLPEIGKELDVDAIVEGTVERSGRRVRISAQLIRTSTDTHLWARSYERDLGDVIALQDDVAGAIANEIRVQISPAEKARLTAQQPVNPEAYEAYLWGLFHMNKRDRADLEQSSVFFQRAVESDSTYALAYVGLADSYALRGSLLYMTMPPQDAMPKSKAAALKALEIDPGLGEAYATLAYVETLYDWNWAQAEQDFKRALALKPNYAQGHLWYAMHLAARGRQSESIAEAKQAQALDPLSLITNTSVGLMFYFSGKYDDAIPQFHKMLELDPNFFVAHWELGLAYEQKGMLAEARSEVEEAKVLSPDNPSILESLAEIDALSGRIPQARDRLRQLTRPAKNQFISPYLIALLYAALGSNDDAFTSLERAHAVRDNSLIFLKVDPALRTLRPDPRFQKLLQRIGLSQN